METKYLLLSICAATFGFIIWYALFNFSLQLPKTFQVQHDVNPPYFNRILRRRLTAFVFYGLVPYLLIFHWKVLGANVHSLGDLGISFGWTRDVTRWMLIVIPLTIIFNWISAGKGDNLTEYPEIRVTIWTPYLLFLSAIFWIIYLVALEFLFRGMVLQSALMTTKSQLAAIAISAGMYSMIHYFKNNRISVLAPIFGVITAYITLKSGSLLPSIFVHVVGGLISEWLAIRQHPELKFQTRLD